MSIRAYVLPLLLFPSSLFAAEERLSPDVRPTQYAMSLQVNPTAERFEGRETIGLQLAKTTAEIRLHAVGLTISSVSVRGASGKTQNAAFTQHDAILSIRPPRPLKAGAAELDITFGGPLATDLRGIYRIKDGADSYVGTQFEAVDARRLAPCFDEPSFKVPVQMTLTVPDGLVAITNAPAVKEKLDEKTRLRTIEFARTPPMSTYLWAILVGPFEIVDAGNVGKTPVRIVVPKGRTRLATYAKDATTKSLAALERYFDRPYPYAKLDMVALPEFGAGAMENPGAVTFREEALLIDENNAPVSARRRILSTVAHELGHMWFGDLVTMAWWDDLWLNEAFATWLSARIVHEVDPKLEAHESALGRKAWAMLADELPGTHPIQTPVESAERAEEIFDAITYGKGAAVLDMLEAWLGDDVFRTGMRLYMNKHAFKNATRDDLFAALGEASGKDVSGVAHAWIDQAGHPLLSVTLDCTGKPKVRIEQKRFEPARPSAAATRWPVPVCLRYPVDGGTTQVTCELARGASSEIALSSATCPAWVHPNAGDKGFYRFALPEPALRALAGGVRGFSVAEKVAFIDNGWALVRDGSLPLDVYLETIEPLRGDENRHVLNALARPLTSLRNHLLDEIDVPAFRRTVLGYYGAAAARLGWDARPDDDETTLELRATALNMLAVVAEEPSHVKAANERARRWLGDPRSVSPDVARIAMSVAARTFTRAEHDAIKTRLAAADTPERRLLLLNALARNLDRSLLDDGLAMSTDARVRLQDVFYVLGPAFEDRRTRPHAFTWVKSHYDELARRLPPLAAGSLPMLAGGLCSKADAADVQAFFSMPGHVKEAQTPKLRQAVEAIELCAAFKERQQPGLKAYLLRSGALQQPSAKTPKARPPRR